jgi:hypothetical protein
MKKIEIFQLSSDNDNLFLGLKTIELVGRKFNFNDYKKVYEGEMDVEDAEDVFMALQGKKPEGYKGHSLSVSDIVKMDGKLLFCDSWGFTKVEA